MAKLFSYVVEHDHGYAPNPFGNFCTLAKCKYGYTSKKGIYTRNIAELAEPGDWIAGTGGTDLHKSAGHGRLIYAMRVDKKIPLIEYCQANFGNRIDAKHDIPEEGRFALISHHYYYFGKNAIDIMELPRGLLNHPFEKTGPGYRSDFSGELIVEFSEWLNFSFKVGIHGMPCLPHSQLLMPKCPTQIRRKPSTK